MEAAFALLAGAMLCVLCLGSGLAIGLKLGRAAGPGLYIAAPRTTERTEQTDMQRMLAAWVDLRLRLMEVALCVRELQQMPHGLLTQWRDEFGRLTGELSQTLDQKLCMAEPKSQPRRLAMSQSARAEEIGHGDLISNAQILDLLSQIGKIRDESIPLVRYKYSAKQFLAPAIDDCALPPESFSMVQCHDLSVRDIRYFVDEPPAEGKVVIGLGLPTPVKWVAAQVEDSRTAYQYGRVGYLVTARLLASIDNRSRAADLTAPSVC
jgi:hypothetical protein